MCGIVGIVGVGEIAPQLVESLARLEYRGYDSCGVATLNSGGVEVRKDIGPVEEVAARQKFAVAHGHMGIAHTRWATHGGVSRDNAHPHLSCDKRFAVVHNGIISNHKALRTELQKLGHHFSSETDTEVLAHLLEETSQREVSTERAFVKALQRLEGSFATVMLSTHDRERIYCARQMSPLILGISPGANFVGSDVNAFLSHTRNAVAIEDGEYAVLSRSGFSVRNIANGEVRSKPTVEISWNRESAEKRGFCHYMEKEIYEQPEAIRRALAVPERQISSLAQVMLRSQRKFISGVGTTYFVALFGQYLFSLLAQELAIAVSSDEASTLVLPSKETALLAISQSGETFDTLQVLRQMNAAEAQSAVIVNVPGSSMTREAGMVIQQDSGPEISVISTKAAMAQMVLLIRLAKEMARLKRCEPGDHDGIRAELEGLPALLETMLQTQHERIKKLAVRHHTIHDWFFLGRGIYTPIAFETALKMKEVTYLHAEGMPAGFLKHGTLSLIDENTMSVFLIPPKEEKQLYDLTMSSVEEVRARKGKVLAFGFDDGSGAFDEEIRLPKAVAPIAALVQLVVGQLLAYETAVALKRNIDRPRSLAKSVTVS